MNDDNNDELFRRAADNYPLKTGSADWESVQDKMNATASSPQRDTARKKRNYKPLLLLLLLIPLAIFENKYSFISDQFSNKKTGQTITSPGQKDNNGANTITTVNTIPGNSTVEPGSTLQPGNSTSTGINISSDPLNKNNIGAGTEPGNFNKPDRPSYTSKQRTTAYIKSPPATDEDNDAVGTIHVDPIEKTTVQHTEPVRKDLSKNDRPNDEKNKDQGEKETKEIKQPEKETVKTAAKNEQKQNKKDKKSKKHFYIGVVGGPDFSTIKLQSVKKTGLNFGFVAGYRINKNISIETGLLKEKKFYSTDGQYFNTKNMYLPAYAEIEYVEGECNMLELPLNIRYTFINKPRSAWFASAGVSSYFMKSESYVYDVNRNGYRYPYSAKYDSKSNSILAVINISAGYTYQLGKICDLRIEPYIKLPVSKIGTGSLPIQSAGVSIGITKNIF